MFRGNIYILSTFTSSLVLNRTYLGSFNNEVEFYNKNPELDVTIFGPSGNEIHFMCSHLMFVSTVESLKFLDVGGKNYHSKSVLYEGSTLYGYYLLSSTQQIIFYSMGADNWTILSFHELSKLFILIDI